MALIDENIYKTSQCWDSFYLNIAPYVETFSLVLLTELKNVRSVIMGTFTIRWHMTPSAELLDMCAISSHGLWKIRDKLFLYLVFTKSITMFQLHECVHIMEQIDKLNEWNCLLNYNNVIILKKYINTIKIIWYYLWE